MRKKLRFTFLLILCILGDVHPQNKINIPIPTQAQLDWQNAELVAVFHYDLHVFDGKRYNQQKNRITPVADYNIFNPEKLNTDQWIKAIKDAGFKMAILTATHETGFALYQSDVNPYSLKALKWRNGKGDIVKDFVESCRKYGIKPGIYIGIRWNSFYGVYDFMVNGDNQFAENRQQYYNRMCEGMVEELMSRYGDLAIVWFDGGAHGPELGGPDVLSTFEKYQSNCLFYHNSQRADIRWGGSESGTVPYPSWGTYPFPYSHSTNQEVVLANNFQLLKEGDPNGDYYMPAMSDAPLRGYNGRHEWFWEPGDEEHIFPVENLMNMYYKSVGHNSTLIMGLTPNPDGLLPEPDVKRLQEWGDEIRRRFENSIVQGTGEGDEVILEWEEPRKINHVILQEDIRYGERIREYTLEGRINGKWQKLGEGSVVGHKRIQFFKEAICTALRFRAEKSTARPQLKNIAVFYIAE